MRDVVASLITDPLLVEMLFCPLMFYGSAVEDDMDWGQFSIMFRSVLLEGFARPRDGVRVILKLLTRRYKELGGELKLRAGVSRILSRDGEVAGVVLDNGQELLAKQVLSSAGWYETMRMCETTSASELVDEANYPPGKLSFIESISVLDRSPRALNFDKTIVFFNDSPKFHYRRPREELADVRSGVICSPNNYDYPEGDLPEGVMRITATGRSRSLGRADAGRVHLRESRMVRPHGRVGGPFRAGLSTAHDRDRHVQPDDDPPLHVARLRRGLRHAQQARRRKHADQESVPQRHRPRLGRHHRRDDQRRDDGQRAFAEVRSLTLMPPMRH
ncbi:MAG: hypothetical protein QM811_13350 [Pirellulales bacterium]